MLEAQAPAGNSLTSGNENTYLAAARLLWIVLAAVILVLVVQAIPLRMEELIREVDQRALAELGITFQSYAIYALTLNLALVAAHFIIASVIIWRRPDDWMALLVSYTLVTNGAMLPLTTIREHGSLAMAESLLVDFVTFISLASSFFLLYTFPNGRFVPRWGAFFAFLWTAIAIPTVFLPASYLSLIEMPALLQLVIILAWPVTGIISQVYRYRIVSNPLQRQQTKWAIFGLMAATIGPLVFIMPYLVPMASGSSLEASNLLYQRMSGSFFSIGFTLRLVWLAVVHIAMLAFPLSFAVAIMRYRLWDIDFLINRAMVYGLLTGLLALVYVVSIVLFQLLFRTITGQGQSAVVTVFSTLLIASLASPLRKRIQHYIDYRFYRTRYNAQEVLSHFSEMIRDEVDLSTLSDKLLAVVEETIQPEKTLLWLREPEGKTSGKRNY